MGLPQLLDSAAPAGLPALKVARTGQLDTTLPLVPLLLLQRLRRESKAKIDEAVEERILSALLGEGAPPDTRSSFRALYRHACCVVAGGGLQSGGVCRDRTRVQHGACSGCLRV